MQLLRLPKQMVLINFEQQGLTLINVKYFI